MRDLLIGALAVAAGIFVEKKYNVSGKIAEQVKKYTDKDMSDTEEYEEEPVEETEDMAFNTTNAL